jgi:hypothetical protein
MKHLAQLQRNFQHCLLDRNNDAVLSAITTNGRAAPVTQLAVYTNAYRLRLREVLANDYPVLSAAVGDDVFDELANAYIEAHPSHGYSLRSFGAKLATFLRKQPGYRETPVLTELAMFEWSLGNSFDAADDPVISIEAMAQIPPDHWPGLQLLFHTSVHRINFVWNTPELWKAHKAETTMPEIRENSAPVPWIIWRQDLKIRFRSLENDEQLIFDAARQGANFADICDMLSKTLPPENVPPRAASILKRWVSDGLISRIKD